MPTVPGEAGVPPTHAALGVRPSSPDLTPHVSPPLALPSSHAGLRAAPTAQARQARPASGPLHVLGPLPFPPRPWDPSPSPFTHHHLQETSPDPHIPNSTLTLARSQPLHTGSVSPWYLSPPNMLCIYLLSNCVCPWGASSLDLVLFVVSPEPRTGPGT